MQDQLQATPLIEHMPYNIRGSVFCLMHAGVKQL